LEKLLRKGIFVARRTKSQGTGPQVIAYAMDVVAALLGTNHFRLRLLGYGGHGATGPIGKVVRKGIFVARRTKSQGTGPQVIACAMDVVAALLGTNHFRLRLLGYGGHGATGPAWKVC